MANIFTAEFIGVIGIPTFILLIVLFFQGKKIDKLCDKVEMSMGNVQQGMVKMNDDHNKSLNDLKIEIIKNTQETSGVKDVLQQILGIEFMKLKKNFPDLADEAKKKINGTEGFSNFIKEKTK